jgi:SAM-dependent methyltransferase
MKIAIVSLLVALVVLLFACRGGASEVPAEPSPGHVHAPGDHDGHRDGHRDGPAHGHTHTHHDGMPHRFERADDWVERFESPERAAWQKPDEVVASLALPPDAKVADLGAGTGYFSVRLARAVPRGRVYASDVEPDMVRFVTERAEREGLSHLIPVQGQANDPALPETVDVVFLCNVYHHIEDRAAFFSAVRDKLTADGRLVLVDFDVDAPDDAPGPPKQHRIAASQAIAELEPLGFELSKHDTDLLPYQYVLTFRAPKP